MSRQRRIISSWAIVAAPFVTPGFFAYYQWFGYQIFLISHILSGEVMLVAIPFYPFESHVVCTADQSLYGFGIWGE